MCTTSFFLLIVFHAVLCPKLNIIQLIETSRQDWFCLLWVMTLWKSLLWLVWWHCLALISVSGLCVSAWCLSRSCELLLIVRALCNFISGDFQLSMGNITALIFVTFTCLFLVLWLLIVSNIVPVLKLRVFVFIFSRAPTLAKNCQFLDPVTLWQSNTWRRWIIHMWHNKMRPHVCTLIYFQFQTKVRQSYRLKLINQLLQPARQGSQDRWRQAKASVG